MGSSIIKSLSFDQSRYKETIDFLEDEAVEKGQTFSRVVGDILSAYALSKITPQDTKKMPNIHPLDIHGMQQYLFKIEAEKLKWLSGDFLNASTLAEAIIRFKQDTPDKEFTPFPTVGSAQAYKRYSI